ncbi:hypothetical protein B9Z55_008884 [Caenorhabditis nigoni]|uniref:Reverse transcriptase domain-containing protein n=1 Tax=Caenorhabditis nigoni TaxID=1611254 RepID=A0A2G5UPJ7_9PELO|nr:hypothetical protein B9Z55_008884 [Caenorhabditis nigoni]
MQARFFVYMDDVIITSETAAQHLADIDDVLGNIGMKLKADNSTDIKAANGPPQQEPEFQPLHKASGIPFVHLRPSEVQFQSPSLVEPKTEKGNSTIKEFSSKIRKLGAYTYDDVEVKARERILAAKLRSGVHKDIRTELRRLPKQPDTLREMAQQAERIHRLLKIEADEYEEEELINAVQFVYSHFFSK